MPPTFGSNASKCPTCGKSVYAAEEVKGPGGNSWHKMCFCCKSCGKSMRGGEWTDSGGDPYCKACHGKQFGPKGIGFGGVLGDTGAPAPASQTQDDAEEPQKRLSMKERMAAFNQGTASTGTAGGYQPAVSSGNAAAPKRSSFQAVASPKCPVCGKSVYSAEEVKGPGGQSWHAMCFCCATCKKSLRGGEWRDNDGQPYCATCHSKSFGPKGIGYGSTLCDTGGGETRIETIPSTVGFATAKASGADKEVGDAAAPSIEETGRIEADRLAQEEADRMTKENERTAREEAERAQEEAIRLAKEAEELAAKAEAERAAREEAERVAKEEEELAAKAEAERAAREEAERVAKEEEDRTAKIEQERKVQEESLRLAREEQERVESAATNVPAVTGPCNSYQIDVRGINFGDCKCGFSKREHKL